MTLKGVSIFTRHMMESKMNEKMKSDIKVAFIGGSGLYEMDGVDDVEHIEMNTPYGSPSDKITVGAIEGNQIAFLPRHGQGHRLLPSEVPYSANIYALKALGAKHIVSISAVGSLKEEIHPQHVVIPDQLIDRTSGRQNTLFGNGIAVHVSFSDPYCDKLRLTLSNICSDLFVPAHYGGTYLTMEGPQFSTKAESHLYRSWGADIIGMTAIPEAKLAREAEMCYVTVAMVTDFDCWKENESVVTAEMIVENLTKNVEISRNIVRKLSAEYQLTDSCKCHNSLENSIITDLRTVDQSKLDSIRLLVDKYI